MNKWDGIPAAFHLVFKRKGDALHCCMVPECESISIKHLGTLTASAPEETRDKWIDFMTEAAADMFEKQFGVKTEVLCRKEITQN